MARYNFYVGGGPALSFFGVPKWPPMLAGSFYEKKKPQKTRKKIKLDGELCVCVCVCVVSFFLFFTEWRDRRENRMKPETQKKINKNKKKKKKKNFTLPPEIK